MTTTMLVWLIAGLTAIGVVFRPKGWPEAIWAVAGAAVLLACGFIDWPQAMAAVAKGSDVYLFLIGMMLLSELARGEGLFDWLAAIASRSAKGSPTRLFALIYVVGVVVTVFLSNDATAVVLTPAVYAACRASGVKDPMPYLLICAMVANAASFVLPISNPANLVIFVDGEMPALSRWLQTFLLPSVAAVVATYICLFLTQRQTLRQETLTMPGGSPRLTRGAQLAGVGLVVAAALLIVASALHIELGMPTFLAGVTTTAIVLVVMRRNPVPTLRHISWGVLPLVAGLFIVVEAVSATGLTAILAKHLSSLATQSEVLAIGLAGFSVAIISNLMNNLPSGLLAGSMVHEANVSDAVAGAVLIGTDLGPNLSVTGSLATILWLAALRREGLQMRAIEFLKIGSLVMFPALFLSLATLALV